jgi:hypothetical protein
VIVVNVYSADGTPQAIPVSLSARYPAFWILFGVGHGQHLVSSITVTSGSTVTIQGGGPITAVNPQLSGSQVTKTFPVLTSAQCAYLSSFWGQIGHGVFINPGVFQPINPACTGDCGPGGMQTVFWGDSESVVGMKNFVVIQGADAAALMKSYAVAGVSEQNMRSLVAANPFVIAPRDAPNIGISERVQASQAESAKSSVSIAEFLGPAIDIKLLRPGLKSSPSSISGIAQVSFSVPMNASLEGRYQIVHLRYVGRQQAWIADNPTTVDRHERVVATVVKETGTYALIRTRLSGVSMPDSRD